MTNADVSINGAGPVRLSVNRAWLGKLPKTATRADWAVYNGRFVNTSLDLHEVAHAIRSGFAISCVLTEPYRRIDNYAAAQLAGVDFDTEDERSRLDVLAAHPFIHQYGWLLYTTASHTEEKPRGRVMFRLSEPVNDPDVYQQIVIGLIAKLGGVSDSHTTAPAQLWFGAPDCELRELGHTLPLAVAMKLIAKPAARKLAEPLAGKIPMGQRHGALMSLAGTMRRRGASEDVIYAAISEMNRTQCDPPGADDTIRAIAHDAAKYEPADIHTQLRANRAASAASVELSADLDPPAAELQAIIVNGRQLRDMTAEMLAALEAHNDPPQVFVRGGLLHRARTDEHGRPLLEALDPYSLRELASRTADFVRKTREGAVEVPPPLDLVRDALAARSWRFPRLVGVVECPVLRPDGTILSEPGYDPATGLIYWPDPDLTLPDISDDPDADEVAAALQLFAYPLKEFPFVGDVTDDKTGDVLGNSSRANMLALMLTGLVRPAYTGTTPAAALSATDAGTGKTLLADVVSLLATGRPAAMSPIARTEELRKNITAKLLAGDAVICFDNVFGVLNNPTLSAVLTAEYWGDRILGESTSPPTPNRAVWMITGNAIQLGGDMPRRVYFVNLDAKRSQPWLRDGFREPNLRGWVRAHRGELIAAGLTLARAWYAEGCPRYTGPQLGSFESWAAVVGGILDHVGVVGFLGNLREMYAQADEEGAAWEAFIVAMHAKFGDQPTTIAQICDHLAAAPDAADLAPDIGEELFDGKDKIRQRFKARLGMEFRARAGRRHGEPQARVERFKSEDAHAKTARWRFVTKVPDDVPVDV